MPTASTQQKCAPQAPSPEHPGLPSARTSASWSGNADPIVYSPPAAAGREGWLNRSPNPAINQLWWSPADSCHESTLGTSWMGIPAPAVLPCSSEALPQSLGAIPALCPLCPLPASLVVPPSQPGPHLPALVLQDLHLLFLGLQLFSARRLLHHGPALLDAHGGDPQGFCGGCAQGRLNSSQFPSHCLPHPLETLRSPAGHTGTNWGARLK